MREGEVESGTRDQLERRQLVGGGSARLGEESHRVLDPAEPEKCRLDFARLGEELHRRGGDDPEGALATDKELLQVVAGVVLAQTSQPVPDLPIGRYDLEAQGQLAGIAVARHRDAAGVGRQIATDLAAALGAEAQWEEPVGLGGGPLQIGEDAAGLDRHREIDRVDRSDAVHAAEGQNDVAAVLGRHGAAHGAGVAALRHDRQPPLGADPHHRRHLGGRSRADDEPGGTPVEAPGLDEKGFLVAGVGDPAARSDRLLDPADGRFDVHAHCSTRGHALRVVATNVVHLEERFQAVGRNWAQVLFLDGTAEGEPLPTLFAPC